MRDEIHVVLGSGPLGVATATALLQRGRRVRMVSRRGAITLTGAEVIRADLFDPAAVQGASAGAAVVYQCAQPSYTEWTTKFEPLQESIIAGVAASGAKLIVAENLYMYGAVDGPIHEGLPYAAHTRKGRVRARMAEQVAEAHRSGRVRTAAVRGSDFFGPGVLGSTLGERVFPPALAGKAAQITGRLDQPHSYTYIGDFGEALATIGAHDEALGQHWHVPSAPAITQRALAELIFREIGQPMRVATVGRVMMRIAGLFIPEARETVEMLYEFERPFVIDGGRLSRAFGLTATPLDQSIRATVAWFRTHQQAPEAAPARA